MRCAIHCESLVASAPCRSTLRVAQRIKRLRSGVTRMSLPQAEAIKRPRTPSSVCASHASVPCDVR